MKQAHNFIDISGQRFGKLTVLERDKNKNGHAYWKCKCDCGKITVAAGIHLRSGHTNSCGCYQAEKAKEVNTIHGGKRDRLYGIWAGIKSRCVNPNDTAYNHYGGRGITICPEWKDDFQTFYDWSMKNGYRDDLTIERKDVNGNYCPENCCWIPLEKQSFNKTNSFLISYKGETKTLTEWAREKGIPYETIRHRVLSGWEEDKLFTPKHIPLKIEFNGEKHTISEWSKITGINKDTIRSRLNKGVDTEHLFDASNKKK